MKGYGSQRLAVRGDQVDAEDGVADQDDGEGDDEGPRAAEAGDVVGDALAEGFLLVDQLVGVAHGAAADDASARCGSRAASTVSMSRPASGLAPSSASMSLRSTSRQVVASVAMAVVWCGVPSSMEAKPKKSPWLGLGEDDFLAVFVDERDVDGAVEHDVGAVPLCSPAL